MANNFNFQASLKLNSGGFKKGVNQVKSSLAGLKSSFLSVAGALGAGLGFAQLISNLRETATQLSVAKNTLENVSRVTKVYSDGINEMNVEVSNYRENLTFVKRLSKEYGQDLVALMTNFAQFTSACKKTDLALEDQKKVYEALTRAAAYYHMSADRTKDMMNAVTQMMSKGKVAAEELRRQLGNALPGAFNLMAAAMGVSNVELDKMMREGKVIAADVLPQFAAMLNTITQDAHFDSLQTSLNNFKNAWYDLVDNSGAESFFKAVVDGSTSIINAIGKNIKGLLSTIKGFVVAIASYKLFKGWEKQGQEYLANQHKNLKTLEKEYQTFLNKFGEDSKSRGYTKNDVNQWQARTNGAITQQDLQALRNYNETLLRINAVKKELYGTPMLSDADIARIRQANIEFDKMIAKTNAASTATKGMSIAMAGIKNVIKTIAATLKSMGIMAIVSAIIGIFTKMVSDFKAMREEWERINNIYSDYQKGANKVNESVEEQMLMLNTHLKTVKDTTKAEWVRLAALDKINEMMGRINDNQLKLEDLEVIENGYDKITLAVERWTEALKIQARVQYEASKYAEAKSKWEELDIEKKRLEAEVAEGEKYGANSKQIISGARMPNQFNSQKYLDAAADLKRVNAEMAQYEKIITATEGSVANLTNQLYDLYNGNGGGDLVTGIAKVFENYTKAKKELDNKLREHAITQEKYNEDLDKLVQAYFDEAAATGELSIDSIIKKMDKGATLTAMEKWYHTLSKAAADAVQRELLDSIAEEISKNIDKEIEEASEAIEEAINKELEKEEKKLNLDIRVATDEFDVKKPDARNPLMDYSKSTSDVLGEHFSLSDDWLNEIKDAYGDLIEESNKLGERTEAVQKKLDELGAYYRYAAREAKTLETAMNYAKIQEDIKALKKEIGNLVYSGVKDFATSIDRVVSAWDTLKKTMEDTDASGWEKFMAVFNLMTQIIDSALGIYQTITTLQELSTKLGAAKIAEQTALNALLKEELALRMAAQGATNEEIAARLAGVTTLLTEKGLLGGILGLKQQENAATATGTALKTAEAAASTAAATASAGEAVAGATASGAKMPFPYNLLAIAAGVAAVVGALAMMSKFEKGGIVGGNSTHGDRNMVRVNSGEMILNKAQQGTLWSMLNGKGGMSGNVEFKIRGADLVGTINNYGKKISK